MHCAGLLTVGRCLLVLVPLLASRAGAQEDGPPAAVGSPHLSAGRMASTACAGDTAASSFDQDLPGWARAQIEVHEAVHRRQLAGDCAAALDSILADPLRHANAEAEAGCAQAAAAADAGFRTFAIGEVRGWLYSKFGSLPRAMIDSLTRVWCGG